MTHDLEADGTPIPAVVPSCAMLRKLCNLSVQWHLRDGSNSFISAKDVGLHKLKTTMSMAAIVIAGNESKCPSFQLISLSFSRQSQGLAQRIGKDWEVSQGPRLQLRGHWVM